MLCRRSHRTFLSRQTGKLVEVTRCRGFPVTERCVKPPVVVSHSVLAKNSKSGIIQDLPHSGKYINSSKVYDICKYDGINIADVRNVNEENKIDVNTTFVHNYDDSNIVDVRHVNKVNKVKSTCVNIYNNSEKEKLERKRCYVCLCKESKHERFSVCGGFQSVHYCSRSCQLKGWKQHQVLCKAISQLVSKRKEKIYKAGVYSATLAASERDQVVQLIGEKCLLNCKMNGIKIKFLLDTRAQVSLIPKAWLNTHLNEHKISKIEEILDPCDKLRVQWGNQAETPFVGWVDITFELTGHGDEESQRLQIPLLKKLYSSQF